MLEALKLIIFSNAFIYFKMFLFYTRVYPINNAVKTLLIGEKILKPWIIVLIGKRRITFNIILSIFNLFKILKIIDNLSFLSCISF